MTFLLTPADLGRYNALLTTVTSLFAMSGLGIGLVLQRESAKHANQKNEVLGEMITTGFICMAFCMFLLIVLFTFFHEEISGSFFGDLDPALIKWIPLLALFYFLVQSPLTIILGMGLFKLYSLRNLIEAFITGLCILTFGYFWHLEGVIYGLAISLFVNAGIVWLIFSRSILREQIALRYGNLRKNARRILAQGIPYFVGNTFIGSAANIVLIGLFSRDIGYSELGYLRIGLSLATILMVVPNAIKTVTVTFIARLEVNAIRLQSLQIRYLFFLIITSTLLLVHVLKPIVSLIFGNAYDAGVNVYIMVLLINVFFSLHQILNSFIAGRGELMYSGIINSVIVILYILCAVFLVPHIGINGYYIAFGGSYFLGLVIFLVHEFRTHAYDNLNHIVVFLAGSFLLIAASMIYYSFYPPHLSIDALSVMGILVYALVCYKYLFKEEERIALHQTVLKMRRFIK